ncbi:amine-terminal domain cyclin (macronuclear) [Tetrahymena thermophila SB210]|uniref:Amine-terminal domain cyclin n=1 Tax=Tetrahymena thermophila (strain SB210) TaxID=312017 RepID=Q23K91_TETTS|nr:amine-terminal domain cyclin [Tetrahymena thermophila SB210]EAR96952.2 amine-terminal domain cyclin [Tetrahymena thermophila SB210]|eukprot:XP_001017197.2 amine-terminal domain cyclin [Tetrahymena thermophila SB210]
MDFQDFYANYLRQQQIQKACDNMKQDEVDYDMSQANTLSNYTSRTTINSNFNQNQYPMQDESSTQTLLLNGSNQNQKGIVGFTNNNLKNQQKLLDVNNQRVFGRELINIDQERTFAQNNIQNNSKNQQSQNYSKPTGYSQIEKQNYAQTCNNNNKQLSDQNNLQQQNNLNQIKCNMSVECDGQNLKGENQQKLIDVNNQRVFGRDIANVDQERTFSQNNMQNSCKIQQSQNYAKPMGYTKIEKQNYMQVQNKDENQIYANHTKNNMYVEYDGQNQQKLANPNSQRVYAKETTISDQERLQQQNNIQNNFKSQQNQNFAKPLGYTKLDKQNVQNNNQLEQNSQQQSNCFNQLKRHMSLECINGDDNQNIKCESNFYSRNSMASQQMQDENYHAASNGFSNNNNTYKANTCKASYDKENFNQISTGFSGLTQSVQQNITFRQKNVMDVENSQQSHATTYRSLERKQVVEYTFPKDTLQKDPIYQYARTIFDYLRSNEEAYCAKGTMNKVQDEITARMRAIMVDWIVDVHLKFKLLPDTLYLTINLIDRYIERKQISKDRLQLLGATSMFIACKFEEIYPPEINDFVFICDSLYTKEQILQMEGELITAINFDLTYTSPLRFLNRYSYLNESTEVQYYCAQYLLELSLIEYKMTEYSSSNQAASALYLVNKIFDQPWSEELRNQSHYDQSSLKKCAKDMYALLQKANEFQYKYQIQVAEYENQKQLQMAQLKQWYNLEKSRLEQEQNFVQDHHEQLEIDYDQKRKEIEAKFKEIKGQLLCNNKNLVAIIRKFSLAEFKEPAKFLFCLEYPLP